MAPAGNRRPRSRAEQVASVFESRQERRARRELAEADQQYGEECPHCTETPEEAHLHGATLYQAGVALF